MNKINLLLDQKYVLDFFRKKVLPKYPDFVEICDIEIKKHKKNIWPNTYHVVFEYRTTFTDKDGKIKIITIFCSAHSDEPRQNAYKALQYLWKQDFSSHDLTIPYPLFYDNYFRAVFYQGVEGINLYRFIRQKNYKEIESVVAYAAKWFAKLHNLPTESAPNFNPQNSRIKTVVPGTDHIFKRIKEKYPEYYNFYQQSYKIFIQKEEEFLTQTKKRWFVHGDAHPENIIRINSQGLKKPSIGVIDFTDLCLSDFARDLGTFFQQADYMVGRKIGNPAYAQKIKNIFLKNYLKYSKIKMTNDLEERIDNYYAWTAMRTATFLLLRDRFDLSRLDELFLHVKNKINI